MPSRSRADDALPCVDADRFRALYAAHADELLRYFARRTLDPQTAIDLVAETFAQAFASRRRFRGGDDAELARAWLYGIAHHLLARYIKRGYAERRALARVGVDPVELSDQSYRRIEELAGAASLREAVAGELARLVPAQREAIALRVVEELPFSEVAARLAISEDTARARVSRGLRALRARLGSEGAQ
jgi:RNA polymerase sigma factor (sigma-70 family)